MFYLSTALLAFASVASATKSLTISTSAPASLSDVSALEVVTTVVNSGDETVKLLNDPRTVLSSWATESFTVVNSAGISADFTGVAVRYIPSVTAKKGANHAFTVLAPGESVSATHELGNFFNFTDAGESTYTITPLSTIQVVEEDGTLTTIGAHVTPASVVLSGQLSSLSKLSSSSLGGAADGRSSARSLSKRASYTSCSSSRQSINAQAISDSSDIAQASIDHLEANPSGSTTQTTWHVTDLVFLSDASDNEQGLVSEPGSWTYDCSCTDSDTYAYVYPSTYGKVYLCGYYWQCPATGSGSRADTIIHEGTHFPQILGTGDYAYGETSCKSLAKSNPARAYLNADNNAFFSDYV
ncbi:related to Peptidyl-Lys metalloendopeptidase [Armillaria ostoyae]|uniref:Related to Peptidyl-Lys metalloendopeptidase n=1 Tax=Armillaria ostoyae TaxID=47428 RepID=A0A284S3D5_ARMOS|nr:related to Peptidyl-Lys metalloendopeptidase [Armillaria ostoyae]